MKSLTPQVRRGIAAGLLWLCIIGSFFVSIRTTIMLQNNVNRIKNSVVTPASLKETQMITEEARAFIQQWATFDQDGNEEYANRLKKYGKTSIISPGRGTQRCDAVNVLQVNKVDDHYRVIASLAVSRLVKVPSNQATAIPNIRIQNKEILGENNEKYTTYWNDSNETVEVAMEVVDDEIAIIGWPVLVANNIDTNKDVARQFDIKEAPADFQVFSKQMLDLYYSGKDLTNYCTAGVGISPVGGFTLERTEIQGIKKDGNKISALIKTSISTSSLSNMEQLIIMDAEKVNQKWFLVRLGGC